MWKGALGSFRAVEIILLLLGAAGFVKFWARTGFWLPRYLHILAGLGLVIGVWCVWASPSTAPIKKAGEIPGLLLALAIPVFIYLFFVLHGGQLSAFNRSSSKLVPCPTCQKPVRVLTSAQGITGASRFAQQQCPHCGNALP